MMRKAVISLALLFLMSRIALAVVATSEKLLYRQPDGTVVTLQLHGDEYHHWTTMDGVKVVLGQDGFYRPESAAHFNSRRMAASKAMAERMDRDRLQQAVAASGRKPFLVILVAFEDLPFTVPNANQAFANLLNQTGYSANGATGSVHDYFFDNSSGAFDPQFEVYGPVTVSKGYAYYGEPSSSASDSHVAEAFNEACRRLDPVVDFSRYDTDGDGLVDNIFFYYAGHNEAEGGGDNTIWPHATSLSTYDCRCDGVRVYRYACSSEYRGSTGSTMCGIGTFCHEFGHVLGLPDFYDTDYEDHGSAATLGSYSLMCSGNYNNSGRTPPYLNIMERYILGWSDGPVEWKTAGPKTVAPIQDNVAYYTPTTTEREWFIYETRTGTGWDNYVGKGLLIYHADRSSTHIVEGISAASRWSNRNKINAYADHPCFYIVQARSGSNNYPFGGASNVTSFTGTTSPAAVDWDGFNTGYNLTGIHFDGSRATLDLEIDMTKMIKGYVKTDKGEAIEGARVTVVPKTFYVPAVTKASAGERIFELSPSAIESAAGSMSGVTDASGLFSIHLDSDERTFYVVVSRDGYVSQGDEVSVEKGSVTLQFVMQRIFTSEAASLIKHDGTIGSYMGISNKSVMGAVMFSAAELKDYVGSQILSVNFRFQGGSNYVYAIIDFGSRRVLTHRLENPQGSGALNKVDVSSYNLTIPEGENVYFGYAVQSGASNYPLIFSANEGRPGGLNYSSFSLTSSSWHAYPGRNLMVSADVKAPSKPLATLGYYLIRNEKSHYVSGDTFIFSLEDITVKFKEIRWFFDGRPADGPSVTLSSGTHVVKAVIDNFDGTTEVLFLTLAVD